MVERVLVVGPKDTLSMVDDLAPKGYEIVKALQSADVRDLLAKQGATAQPDSPAEFAAFMKSERIRIGNLGKRAGITLE